MRAFPFILDTIRMIKFRWIGIIVWLDRIRCRNLIVSGFTIGLPYISEGSDLKGCINYAMRSKFQELALLKYKVICGSYPMEMCDVYYITVTSRIYA